MEEVKEPAIETESASPEEAGACAPEEVPAEVPPVSAAEEAPEVAPVDYAVMAEEDLKEIRRLDPAYAALTHLGELPHAMRFAQLRDLGLTVEEALAASNPRFGRFDGREHLRPPTGRALTSAQEGMPGFRELEEARALFGDLDDRQIAALYRRVRGN